MNNELNSITILEMSSLTKERPRTNFYTRAVYTPKKTKDNEKIIAQEFMVQNPRWLVDRNPLKVSIEVFLNIPKGITKSVKVGMANDEIKPLTKPDVDNIAKLVLDALNGVAFVDDKQIVELSVKKRYWDIESQKSKNKLVKIYIEKEMSLSN